VCIFKKIFFALDYCLNSLLPTIDQIPQTSQQNFHFYQNQIEKKNQRKIPIQNLFDPFEKFFHGHRKQIRPACFLKFCITGPLHGHIPRKIFQDSWEEGSSFLNPNQSEFISFLYISVLCR
jgi:hypothetical protein